MTSHRFDAILCGAGISVAPPTSLPSGEALAEEVAKLLLASNGVYELKKIASSVRRAAGTLRLEQLLEVLSQHISLKHLASIYKCMQTALPNCYHFAISQLDSVDLLTTNQDVLLERAAWSMGLQRHVIHLHGRCDRPSSVITAVGQYMAGLPRARARDLKASIHGRSLIVIGYSGRDRDIMTAIHCSAPRRVLWIRHPGSAMSPELERLSSLLGSRMTCVTKNALTFIESLLPTSTITRIRAHVATLAPMRWTIPPEVRTIYESIPTTRLNAGLAQVLRHVGEYDLIVDAYGTHAHQSPRLKLALASAYRHREDYRRAIMHYRQISRQHRRDAFAQSLARLGEVESLRRMSQVQRAMNRLRRTRPFASKINDTREQSRVLAICSVIEAGVLRAAGKLKRASQEYKEALRFCKSCRDLETHLEAQLWYADVLRMMGEYDRAERQLASVAAESQFYTRNFTRGWVPFVQTDVSIAMGDLIRARNSLRIARHTFRSTSNSQGQAWVELLSAVLARLRERPGVAEERLRRVDRLIQSSSTPLAFLSVRLALEQAELARHRNEAREMSACLRHAYRLTKDVRHFGQVPRYLQLHCELVTAEWNRQMRQHRTGIRFEKLSAAYKALGFHGMAARCSICKWLIDSGSSLPSKLLRE